jgi:hypothetical protein
MKTLSLILTLLASSVPAMAAEFRLSGGEIGPIVVSAQVRIRDKKEELTAYPQRVAEFTATARNESELPIRYARFCVQTGRRTKGCDFEFSNKWIWMPGEEMIWMIDKHARPGMDKVATVMLIKIQTQAKTANPSN